ncbi:Aste57867_15446 [Aphanomyces stellatus]|uniref:Non-structural maintenance of chromosomes element 4 n=1 Tax=Aphanomyces stellatus TaxID=120398 RepID=A0A485L502_9STRA|nr:hypothetical protein As57867_015390 [Aphanomyces stellatus]VFT92248.1 Aste57867_15446 [Aphanomyces stellatus]
MRQRTQSATPPAAWSPTSDDDQAPPTSDERRAHCPATCQALRTLRDDIILHRHELAVSSDSDMLSAKMDTLDAIFATSNTPRELSLDAQVLDQLANAVSEQGATMAAHGLSSFRACDLIHAARVKCLDGAGDVDWPLVGAAAGSLFRSTPRASFIHLGREEVTKESTRRQGRRRAIVNDVDDADTPTLVDKKDHATTEETTHATRLRTMYKVLETHGGGVSLFALCLHPTSFGQTVENLFDFSFLIQAGHASLEVDANGLPHAAFNAPCQRANDMANATAIVGLSYYEWEALAEGCHALPLVGDRTE